MTGYGQVIGTLPSAPSNGNMVVAISANDNGLTAPTGWAFLANTGGNVLYGYIGVNGLTAATSYNFTGNGSMIQLFEISGASGAPVNSTDTQSAGSSTHSTSLTIPSAGRVNLIVIQAVSAYTSPLTAVSDSLPSGQTESVITASFNNETPTGSTGNGVSLRSAQITSEAFNAPKPFAVTSTFSTGGYTVIDEVLVSIGTPAAPHFVMARRARRV